MGRTHFGTWPIARRGAGRALLIAVLFVTASCTTAPPPATVAVFAAALGTTTSSLRAGYQAAQSVEIIESRVVLTTKAMCRQDNCPRLTTLAPDEPILTDDLLDLQYQVLSGLNAYADLLASLTDPKTQTLVSQSVAGLGTSLKGLGAELGKVSGGQLSLDPAVVAEGTTALGALGDFLVNEKLNAELPKIIEQNHPMIVNIGDYLDATIGTPVASKDKSGKTVPPHGLRAILKLKLDKIDLNSAVLVDRLRRDGRVGSVDLIAFTGKAYDDNLARVQQTDAALVEIQAAIRKMVSAHAALRAPSDPSTFAQLQSFIAFAQRAKDAIDRAQGK